MAQILTHDPKIIQPELNREEIQIEIKPSFPALITGRWDHKYEKFYIWSVFLSLVVISVFAQLVFPTKFSWITKTISDQGSFVANPSGHLLWRIGVIINGIAHIPHILYIKNHIGFIHPKLANLFGVVGISSAVGFSLVGLISMDYGPIHYVFALIAFVGYYFAGNFTFLIINRKSNPAYVKFKKSGLLKLFYLFFNVSGLGCLFSFLFYETPTNQRIYPPVEWAFLIAICIWLLIWPRMIKTINSAKK
ncbi:hypothetical protein NEF87_003667 [Candidatus Lokiarchaeum ossiferum]|uniref:DUF998 domain-containing protein n=1 Tax=Candidatus Lokiarchaeum ossiferum TaxID=2951803 RepID=A0ABY6HX20_9ARCH|nr:hypothetical protein NEF87_003667 [Candidatus Lokiarchaeum sp. B-35]